MGRGIKVRKEEKREREKEAFVCHGRKTYKLIREDVWKHPGAHDRVSGWWSLESGRCCRWKVKVD
jgi:hypothetical protein